MKSGVTLATAAISAILSLSATLGACAGLDTGNGEVGDVELALSLDGSTSLDSGGASFTFTQVRANVRHIDLYLPSGDKRRVEGPWSVDLVTGQATPPFPRVEDVPIGGYRRVDIRFAPGDDDVTLAAIGTVPFQSQPTPFTLALSFDEDARFEGSPIVLDAGGLASLVARLDPSEWFANLPLSECAADGDLPIDAGTIVITDHQGACSDIEGDIKDAIKASGALAQ